MPKTEKKMEKKIEKKFKKAVAKYKAPFKPRPPQRKKKNGGMRNPLANKNDELSLTDAKGAARLMKSAIMNPFSIVPPCWGYAPGLTGMMCMWRRDTITIGVGNSAMLVSLNPGFATTNTSATANPCYQQQTNLSSTFFTDAASAPWSNFGNGASQIATYRIITGGIRVQYRCPSNINAPIMFAGTLNAQYFPVTVGGAVTANVISNWASSRVIDANCVQVGWVPDDFDTVSTFVNPNGSTTISSNMPYVVLTGLTAASIVECEYVMFIQYKTGGNYANYGNIGTQECSYTVSRQWDEYIANGPVTDGVSVPRKMTPSTHYTSAQLGAVNSIPINQMSSDGKVDTPENDTQRAKTGSVTQDLGPAFNAGLRLAGDYLLPGAGKFIDAALPWLYKAYDHVKGLLTSTPESMELFDVIMKHEQALTPNLTYEQVRKRVMKKIQDVSLSHISLEEPKLIKEDYEVVTPPRDLTKSGIEPNPGPVFINNQVLIALLERVLTKEDFDESFGLELQRYFTANVRVKPQRNDVVMSQNTYCGFLQLVVGDEITPRTRYVMKDYITGLKKLVGIELNPGPFIEDQKENQRENVRFIAHKNLQNWIASVLALDYRQKSVRELLCQNLYNISFQTPNDTDVQLSGEDYLLVTNFLKLDKVNMLQITKFVDVMIDWTVENQFSVDATKEIVD